MTALFLTQPHYQIRLQAGVLQIRHPQEGHRLIPWHGLKRLVLGPGVDITSDVILKLAEHHVELLAFNQHQTASLSNLAAPHDGIRLQQYAVTCDLPCRTRLVQRLVMARAEQQRTLLARYGSRVPAIRSNIPRTAEQWMLEEAHQSLQYWQHLTPLLLPFGFTGRQRRPPRDPVNALLSLTSTLEQGLLARVLLAQGLDIGLGLHHSTGYRRQSLVLDVQELTRATLEHWVIQLFLDQVLDPQHFCQDEARGCRLTAKGQQIFYPAWHRFTHQRQRSQQRLARLCRRLIEREARHATIPLAD